MGNVALIIIYNHQYNKNIAIVERLYKPRFSNIYHLVPFYNGDQPNVIAVYDSSYYFQGYVAQGFKSFFKEDHDHYLFIGDDLILNPLINENNYTKHLKLDKNTCFIPRLTTIDQNKGYWPINYDILFYDGSYGGVEAVSQLPKSEEAVRLLSRFGLKNRPLNFNQIWQSPGFRGWRKMSAVDKVYLLRLLKNKFSGSSYSLTYPLLRSYSDIFVVSRDAIKKFCHYCGVFTATRVFVEVAIPTAMAFAAEAITTEKELALQGRALWTSQDHALLDKYQHNLQSLLNDFPPGLLYLHPVKLSKWKSEL